VADIVDGASSNSYDCYLYKQDAATGDLDETAATAIQTSTCTWNYELDPLGNALQFSGFDQSFKNVEGSVFNEYVFSVKNVGNPFDVHTRDTDDLDVEFTDPTPFDNTDAIKWVTYDGYTSKFELGVFDTAGTVLYNARAFGALNSAWLGFSAKS
jgi:hypothetical protein